MLPNEFFPSYIQTYVERDVRQVKNIGDLVTFNNFIHICAGSVGQTVNYASLAKDAGISPVTARQWLSILETSYILFTVPTYYKNLNQRHIKMPKLYFYDTGLAAHLLGFQSVKQCSSYYRFGGLFENLVILEILKARLNKGLLSALSFWKDSDGVEVDLIGEWNGIIHAIEIKSGATCNPSFFKNIEIFKKLREGTHGYVVYTGSRGTYQGNTLVPLADVGTFFTEEEK